MKFRRIFFAVQSIGNFEKIIFPQFWDGISMIFFEFIGDSNCLKKKVREWKTITISRTMPEADNEIRAYVDSCSKKLSSGMIVFYK